MNTRIWKYVVPINDAAHAITLPALGKIVHVGMVGRNADQVSFWHRFGEAALDAKGAVALEARLPRLFRVFATGESIPDGWEYVGTAIDAPHGLVWHLHQWDGAK